MLTVSLKQVSCTTHRSQATRSTSTSTMAKRGADRDLNKDNASDEENTDDVSRSLRSGR